MKTRSIILERAEFNTISELIKNIGDSENLINVCITKLKEEMKTATIIDDAEFPEHVIRLNSIVDIETPFGLMKAQLVLPHLSNSTQKRISLLTPMGSALLGYSEGDILTWNFPNGEQKIKVIKVT